MELGKVLLEDGVCAEAEGVAELGMVLLKDGFCDGLLLEPALAAMPLCEASPAALPGLPGVALALPLIPALGGIEADELSLTVSFS